MLLPILRKFIKPQTTKPIKPYKHYKNISYFEKNIQISLKHIILLYYKLIYAV